MDEYVEPGSVFYLFCENTNPQKHKYLVLLSVNPIFWFFINSEIPPFIIHNQGLLIQQVDLIKYPNHMFLTHDSHIDCSEVIAFSEITLENLNEWILDPNIFKGIIHQSVIEEMIPIISASITISPYHKEIIIKSLS